MAAALSPSAAAPNGGRTSGAVGHEDVGYLLGIHDFEGRSADELSIKKGDHIQVVETDKAFGDGWYIGQNLRTQQTGLFPKVFTTPLLLAAPPNINAGKPRPSVHDTITDIDAAISEINNNGNDAAGAEQTTTQGQDSSTPSLSNIPEWTPYEVQRYFESRGYDSHVCQQFVLHKITGAILLELDLAYLKEIDISSFGTRFELSKDIRYLNGIVKRQHDELGLSNSTSEDDYSPVHQSPPRPMYNNNSNNNGQALMQAAVINKPASNAQGRHRFSRDSATLPITPRTSSLRSDGTATETTSSPVVHRREPSFNRDWTHPSMRPSPKSSEQPGRMSRQSTLNQASTPRTPDMRDQTIPDMGPPGSIPAAYQGPPMFESPASSLESMHATGTNSLQPKASNNVIRHKGRLRAMTIGDNKNMHPQHDILQNAKLPPIVNDSSLNSEGHQFYQMSKHTRSTSSITMGEKSYFDSDDVVRTPEEHRQSHRRHSSVLSFMSNCQQSLPKHQKRSTSPLRKELRDEPVESPDGAYNDLETTSSSEGMSTTGQGKRVGTDPVRGSDKVTSPVAKRPFMILRNASSQYNLRRGNSKQKTSAFVEGLRSVTAQDSAKDADYSGWMTKRGGIGVGTWKSRYFTLHGTRLSYFSNINDTRERGLIDITAHRVLPARENEDKLVTLYAASIGAGKYCFKLVPPAPGYRKGVTFTLPKLHYFAVETKEEMRAWMAALMKATIERDESVPAISSCSTPTVSLPRAQELFAEARNREEDLRAKMVAGGLANVSASSPDLTANAAGFGKLPALPQLSQYADLQGYQDELGGAPQLPVGDSSANSSLKSTGTDSSATNVSSIKVTHSEPSLSPANEIRHLTTKVAGLRVVTDMNNQIN